MNLRTALAGVLAKDPRYSFPAYQFVFESLDYAKTLKRRRLEGSPRRPRSGQDDALPVTGQELCWAALELARMQYGLLALAVLGQWGLRSTSDVGNIVYNLIDSGDFEMSPGDSRGDFDDVFDFEEAFRRKFVLALDDVA